MRLDVFEQTIAPIGGWGGGCKLYMLYTVEFLFLLLWSTTCDQLGDKKKFVCLLVGFFYFIDLFVFLLIQ